MRGRWSLAIAGLILILAGGLLAHLTQTSGGIRIQDVRFKGAKGNTMSALLYVPSNATPQIPAPGILAVHGYINSRETQDGFRLAEEDLRLRGGGELLGTRQSGDTPFRVADFEQIARLLPLAHDDARLLIDRDGGLDGTRGQAARLLLFLFERDWGVQLLRGG